MTTKENVRKTLDYQSSLWGEMMLEKYSEVLGLPVICIDNGKKIGCVKDVVFYPGTREVKAFLLERSGCQLRKKIILLRDVLNVGKDAIVVNNCSCARNLNELDKAEGFHGYGRIIGLRIYSKSGNDLGTVKDVLFDSKTGIVEGVEVSDGLFHDLVQGRNMLPLFGKVEFSEENILVDKEAIDEMVHNGGGLKRRLSDNKKYL